YRVPASLDEQRWPVRQALEQVEQRADGTLDDDRLAAGTQTAEHLPQGLPQIGVVLPHGAAGDVVEDVLLQHAVQAGVGEGQLQERPFAEGAVGRRAGTVVQEQIDCGRVPDQGRVVVKEAAVADVEQVANAAQFALDDLLDVAVALQAGLDFGV